jgi:glycosyltransferase involved in cell wall biosynthesis
MSLENKKDLSFIIPALNEEEHIGGVLDAIRDCVEERFSYEIIVVDNGSIDRTVSIANEKGATCLHAPECTISTLRNLGGAKARASILVFVDADVYLAKEWGSRIKTAMSRLQGQPDVITGSLYGISGDDNWIEKTWFAPRTLQADVKYINGGHLIIHKDLFSRLGGFDSLLETGEDYEFCVRARRMGASIENDSELKVVHAGYPKSIKRFFFRERWHARGDYVSLRALLSSKPALASLLNLLMIGLCGVGVIAKPQLWIGFIFTYIFFIVGVSIAASVSRCQGKFNPSFFYVVFLYVIYFTARTVAIIDVAFDKFRQRKK